MQNDNKSNFENFPNEEPSKLEERIIAHFDDSLDHASSKALLDEVAASPEKRALFLAHETLDRVIAAARVPMEAPLETRREIADRIPGLLAFIPGLLGTAETMPVLQQSVNPFIAFFTRMSFSTAVSIGAAVALLTTAGIIVTNNLSTNTPTSTSLPSSKIAAVQSALPAAAPNYAMAPSGLPREHASEITGRNNSSNVHSIKASGLRVASTPIRTINNASNKSVSNDNIAASNNNNAPSNEDIAASNEVIRPVVKETIGTLKPSAVIAANIPVLQTQILTPEQDEVGEAITVRPYASYGQKYIQLNQVGENSESGQLVTNSVLGVEFDLGDRYAFRVQGGSSSFAQTGIVKTSNSVSVLTGNGFVNLPVYESAMHLQSAAWTTVGVSYALAITPTLPLILGGDVGGVWLTHTGIMGLLRASTEIPLMNQLSLQPSVNYEAVRTSIQPSSPPNGNSIYEPIVSSSMWTRAFGFQLNVVFRP